MLTSGGDCQALNAAMRGVAKTLFNAKEEVEIYGFLDGYKGLIYGKSVSYTHLDVYKRQHVGCLVCQKYRLSSFFIVSAVK